MRERRGLSHIEFVISFVIFIAFIAFAFAFFNPLQSNRTMKSTLDYAWIEIDSVTKSDLETYSISIGSSISQGDPIAINILGVPVNFNASIEDVDGNLINSYKFGTEVNFENPAGNFVRIKYSPVFSNGLFLDGELLDDGNSGGPRQYTISSSEIEELNFEVLFDDLNKSYFSNYTGLKKQFNLPNRVNFGFVAKFNETYEITAMNKIPEESEVLSKSERIQAVSKSGLKEFVDLRVLVW